MHQSTSPQLYGGTMTPATDADYTSDSDSISDEDLYAKMWDNIEQFERVIPYPYIDTTGNITIGAGANVNNWDDFRQLNLTVMVFQPLRRKN